MPAVLDKFRCTGVTDPPELVSPADTLYPQADTLRQLPFTYLSRTFKNYIIDIMNDYETNCGIIQVMTPSGRWQCWTGSGAPASQTRPNSPGSADRHESHVWGPFAAAVNKL